jgi:hypothetical protein
MSDFHTDQGYAPAAKRSYGPVINTSETVQERVNRMMAQNTQGLVQPKVSPRKASQGNRSPKKLNRTKPTPTVQERTVKELKKLLAIEQR